MPTEKPEATATLAPLVTGATLGGPTAAFCAKYSAYDVNPGTFAQCSLFDVNGLSISLNDDTGADGKPHVFSMMVYKTDGTTWTIAQAQSICRTFLPSQSTYQRQTTTSEGNPEEVYTSTLLVHTFASSSSWYDPTGAAAITYVIRSGGVFQCDMDVYV